MKFYRYTAKIWVLVDQFGRTMSVSDTKSKTWRKFIFYYEIEKDILKEWRWLKREGWQVVRATATYEFELEAKK